MCRLTRSLLVVALWLALVPPAQAQTVGLKHLWTVPAIVNSGSGNATVFGCTNGGASTQTIAVDLYGPVGAFVVGSSIPVAPASTVLFSTNTVNGWSIDVNLGSPALSKGHARILSSASAGILCTAFYVDAVNGVPSANLTIAKALKQKGD